MKRYAVVSSSKGKNVRENGWERAKLCWENAIMRDFVRKAEPSEKNIPLWTLDKNGEYTEITRKM